MAEKKDSPWLGKSQVEVADLPEEVYEQKLDDDDEKLERAIAAARLIETPVTPEPQWKTCWACGKKVPLRFRDPVTGILVCRACLWIGVQQDFYDKFQGLFGGIGDFLESASSNNNDDDDGEPAFMEGTDEPGELSETLEDADAPEVPQGTSPSTVEKAGGPPSKDEDESEEE